MLKKCLIFENFIKIILFLGVVLFSLLPLSDLDMFFHIKNGEYILANGIPKIDPYSMHSGLIFLQHEWLSDIIFFSIYAIAGFYSLWIFKIVYVICFFMLVYYVLKNMINNKFISFMASGTISIFCVMFYVIRPQIFSYLLLLCEILLLENYEKTKNKRYLYGLPIISVFLINFHGAVMPLFFVFAFVYILSNWLKSINIRRIVPSNVTKAENNKILIFIAISFFASILNPYGINTYFYSLKTLASSSVVKNITELRPLTVNSGFGLLIFVIFLGMIFIMTFTKGKAYLKQFLFICGTFFMAFSSMRFVSYFIIFGSVFFAQFLSRYLAEEYRGYIDKFRTVDIIKNIIFLTPMVFIILVVISIGIRAVNLDKFPTQVISTLKNEKNLKLFNDFNYGHFLIFNDIKVFIDGRAEMYDHKMNNTDVFDEFVSTINLSKNPKDVFNKYNFNYYLLKADRPLLWYLKDNPEYVKLFENEYYVLYKNKY